MICYNFHFGHNGVHHCVPCHATVTKVKNINSFLWFTDSLHICQNHRKLFLFRLIR